MSKNSLKEAEKRGARFANGASELGKFAGALNGASELGKFAGALNGASELGKFAGALNGASELGKFAGASNGASERKYDHWKGIICQDFIKLQKHFAFL